MSSTFARATVSDMSACKTSRRCSLLLALVLAVCAGAARAGGPCTWTVVASSCGECVGIVSPITAGPEQFCGERGVQVVMQGGTLTSCLVDGLVVEEASFGGGIAYTHVWQGTGSTCTEADEPAPPASAASGAATEATVREIADLGKVGVAVALAALGFFGYALGSRDA